MAYRFVFERTPHCKQDIFYFHFSNLLTKEDITQLTQKVRETLEKENSVSMIHIWDCTDMTQFNLGAKSFLEVILKENNKQIDSVYLISNKKLIKLAGKIMSVIINCKLIVLDSIDQMPAHISDDMSVEMFATI